MLMKKFQELRRLDCCSVPAFYGQDSHSSNLPVIPDVVQFHSASARSRAQTLGENKPCASIYTHPERERPNGYRCPYPCRISTDALDLSRCMPFRRADWSGSCTPSTYNIMWLPHACLGDNTSARSPLLHGSDNRVQ